MKRKVLIALGAIAALLAIAIAGLGTTAGYYVNRWPPTFPDTPYPEIEATTDPAVVARGAYLFHAVTHCTICHTKADGFLGNPNVAGMAATGHHKWELGPLGTFYSANVTTTAPDYTDAELARLLKTGIGKNHEPVPLMGSIGPMSEHDLTALVSYVRTLPVEGTDAPPSELSAMGKVMLQVMLGGFVKPNEMEAPPFVLESSTPSIDRGNYLANGPAFCFVCHSELEINPVVAVIEPRFGGAPKADPDPYDDTMEIISPNLTSHATGRTGQLSEDAFVARMRAGRTVKGSPMPWENYALMTDADLRSMYRYLASVPPVDHDVGPPHRPLGWTP